MNQLDEAEIRLEMRRHYRELGFSGCLQVLLELLTSAAILAEVMAEEKREEKKGMES